MPLDLNSNIKIAPSIYPTNSGAATIDSASTAVDTKGYHSAMVAVAVGAASGTPDTQSVIFTVQKDTASAFSSATTVSTFTAITADNGSATVHIPNLGTAQERYLRVKAVIAFTGGSSPAIEVAANVILGTPDVAPVS